MGGITRTLGLTLGAFVATLQLGASVAQTAVGAQAGFDAEPPGAATDPSPASRGLYTAAQASRGERRFTQLCADCHRTVEITRSWFSGYSHQTAGELFMIMSMTMPESSPGSLDDDDYADILAYLLQLNDYPAGDEELPADTSVLGAIAIPAP